MRTKKRHRGSLALLLLLLFLFPVLSGCGDGKRIVLTTGFEEDEVFRMEGISCYRWEMLIYLTNIQNQYGEVYGQQIWGSTIDGVPLEENVRQTVLARVAKIKMMNLLAANYNLELSEEEIALVQQAAKEYFNSLSPEEVEAFGDIKEADIAQMYEEYALAHKVYNYLIADVNPEISDDEARTVVVKQIVLPIVYESADGTYLPYSTSDKGLVRTTAEEILTALADGADFDTLMISYGSPESGVVSFRKNEREAVVEEAVFLLEEGEVSGIIEGEQAYYIFYCVTPLDREETDNAKIELAEERRKDAFNQVYEFFIADKDCYLNEEVWNEIVFIGNETINTSNFFDIYERYFP